MYSGDRSHPYRKDRWQLHFYFCDHPSRAKNRYDIGIITSRSILDVTSPKNLQKTEAPLREITANLKCNFRNALSCSKKASLAYYSLYIRVYYPKLSSKTDIAPGNMLPQTTHALLFLIFLFIFLISRFLLF